MVLGDIFDTLTGKNKTPDVPEQAQLDPQSQTMINQIAERAGGPTDMSNLAMAKQNASSLVPSVDQMNQQSAKLAQDPYFDRAAMRYAQDKYGQKEQRYGDAETIQQSLRQSQQLAQAAQHALGQQRVKDNQYSFLTQIYNEQEAARAGFINSIFQTGAYAVGRSGGNKNANANSGGGIQTSGGGYEGQMPNGRANDPRGSYSA